MKKILAFATLTLLASELIAQKITIIERKINVKGGHVNTWTIPVGDNRELAKKTFISFSKKKLKLRPESQGKMMVIAMEADIPSISDKRGDFRGILFSEANTYKMGISFAFGYDIVINSHDYPKEMSALRDITVDYLRYHYTRFYDQMLEQKERERKKLEKRVKQIEKEIGSLRSSTRKSEKRIYKTEDPAIEIELQNKIARNKLTIQDLNLKLPPLRYDIERKSDEIKDTKSEYNDVMAQIRALQAVV